MNNISDLIDERLWNEVKKNYLNEQFSQSVLDGVQFLGDLVREMSGEDGDGYNLIGRVFNEKNPKIKVNRLSTHTERDIQKGVMYLLQGFYTAVRNERVHQKKIDTEQEAFELILFLNHLLRIIDKSKGKFTIENTLKRVFDENFLPRREYAKHIIKDIPPTKKYEVAIEVLRNINNSHNESNLAVFWDLLKNELKVDEIKEIRQDISESLRFSDDPRKVTSIILLIGNDWENLEEDSRLRAENLLIRSLPSYLSDDPRNGFHELEFTEIANSLYELYTTDLMLLEYEFSKKIYSMLKQPSFALTDFVIKYFGGFLKELENESLNNLEAIIIKKFKSGDKQMVSFVDRYYTEEKASELKKHLPIPDLDDDLPF